MPGRAIDVVLFDLGGVLMDPGGVAPMRALSGIDSDEELWRRWLTCRWVRSFERGRCAPEEFAAGVVGDWGLEITPGDFLTAFAGWPRGPLEGAPALVGAVRRLVPVGCLSNTNVLHWEAHFSTYPFVSQFDHTFLSFRLGMVKPDGEIFDEVARRLALPRPRILFLDDNTLNVDAATEAGLVAVRTQGVSEAREALARAGVLPGSPRR